MHRVGIKAVMIMAILILPVAASGGDGCAEYLIYGTEYSNDTILIIYWNTSDIVDINLTSGEGHQIEIYDYYPAYTGIWSHEHRLIQGPEYNNFTFYPAYDGIYMIRSIGTDNYTFTINLTPNLYWEQKIENIEQQIDDIEKQINILENVTDDNNLNITYLWERLRELEYRLDMLNQTSETPDTQTIERYNTSVESSTWPWFVIMISITAVIIISKRGDKDGYA